MKTVIMAGGKGTRISSVASDIPKPMIEACGKPILQYQIECLEKQGFTDIIIVVGYLGCSIKEYFNDGTAFGVNIKYFEEIEPLGTAGALAYLKEELKEDFLLLNGDIIFDIDLKKFFAFHREKRAKVSLFTHPNNHPYDSALVIEDANNCVVEWLHKEEKREDYKNCVNAGVHIISTDILNLIQEGVRTDLDRDVLKLLIQKEVVFSYNSSEYIKDMGTPKRYDIVCRDIQSGKVIHKSLRNKQKAIFLDRDGTINKYKGFINKVDQVELIEGVSEAIAKINDSEYLTIVVTNQPIIARGECTFEELDKIHKRLETLLGNNGAYIDGLYFCPHHPDKGFDGERIEYKIDCNCRKPKPGLLLRASEDFNIDLSKSYMIGDDLRDIVAGTVAGCKVMVVGEDLLNDSKVDCDKFLTLNECIDKII